MSESRGYSRRRRPKYAPKYSTAAVEDITRLAERTVDAAMAAVRLTAPSMAFVHPEPAMSTMGAGFSEAGFSEAGFSEAGFSEAGYSKSGYSEVGFSTMGASVSTMGASVSTMGASVSATGASVSTMGASVSATGASVSTMGASVSTMGASVSTMEASVSTMGASVSTMGASVSTMGASVSTMGASVSTTGASFSGAGFSGVVGYSTPTTDVSSPEQSMSFTHPVLAYSAPPSRNRKILDPNSKEFIPPMKLLAKSADAIIDESADYSIWLDAATRPATARVRPVPMIQYPAVALTHLLPYCLRDGQWKKGVEVPSWAHPGTFNCWLTLALLESDCLRLLHVDAVVADDLITQYSDDKLWRCGAALARRAPCQGPGYTTYHRLVMCVAEQMSIRGLSVS